METGEEPCVDDEEEEQEEEEDERLQQARKESEDYLQRGKDFRFMQSTPAEKGDRYHPPAYAN